MKLLKARFEVDKTLFNRPSFINYATIEESTNEVTNIYISKGFSLWKFFFDRLCKLNRIWWSPTLQCCQSGSGGASKSVNDYFSIWISCPIRRLVSNFFSKHRNHRTTRVIITMHACAFQYYLCCFMMSVVLCVQIRHKNCIISLFLQQSCLTIGK